MNSLIRKEYFGLINKLNQSNKLKNQDTKIYFYIDNADYKSAKLYAAISDTQKILLCEKLYNLNYWESLYLSGFSNLEDFLVTLLNEQKHGESLTDFIKLHIFEFE